MLDTDHDGTAGAERLPVEFLYTQIDMLRDEVAELRLEVQRLRDVGARRSSHSRPGGHGRLVSVEDEVAALSARLDLLLPGDA